MADHKNPAQCIMTKIQLHDSMTQRKRNFLPQDSSRVTMYVCGPTVYDTPHIGNARPAVVFDVLFRMLRYHYGEDAVHYVRNITDVDDKIAAKSVETGVDIAEITQETTEWYHRDMAALNVLSPTYEPKVTESMEEIHVFIEELIQKGYAYQEDGGDVFFDLSSWPEHGKLSRHKREDLNQGEEQAPGKRHPQDFVLWKENHQRPGWHIECSAMIRKHLGNTIDIHGGGADLRFPHHENEIAQSEAANGVPLANFWMHNGMLTVNGKKMSKSLGNFVTVQEALENYPGEVIRFFLLKTHYRRPLNWTWSGLESAREELDRLYRKMYKQDNDHHTRPFHRELVMDILADDLNTPLAIAKIHEYGSARHHGRQLGIMQYEPEEWFKLGINIDPTFIEDLIDQRAEARDKENWKRADQLRDRLHSMGIELEDGDFRTTWRKK